MEDPNDPTFSPWTEPVEMTEPVPLTCPLGRFCQYKLILRSAEGQDTPVIREVAVASSIPNLPPVVESVEFVRIKNAAKRGFYLVKYSARDANDDRLIYTLYFRKLGRSVWIKLKEDHDQGDLEWDIVVRSIPKQRRPASEAMLFYEESPESVEKRRARIEEARLIRAANTPLTTTRPSKRDRRLIHRFTRKSD